MIIFPPGATPLDHDEMQGLIHPAAATRGALDYLELANIRKAEKWAFGQFHENLLTSEFIKNLHRRMFEQVWKWAGQYRKTEKNIGVITWNISTAVYELCNDVQAQISHKSFPPDELAARFHHKLVYIHPFPNGNGRLSRVMTDLLLASLGEPRFTWGNKDLIQQNNIREKYIEALRAADAHNYQPLFAFVRS